MNALIERRPNVLLERNESLLYVAKILGRIYTQSLYAVVYKNLDALQKLGDRGFFVLANHLSFEDIILEYLLIKDSLGKSCRTIMRDSLPGMFLLRRLGGLPMPRTQEYRKRSQKAKTETWREEVKSEYLAAKKELFEAEKELMHQKQVIVIHPEGTRKKIDRPLTIRLSLEHIINLQEELGLNIPCVALNIYYEAGVKYLPPLGVRPKVILTVTDPIEVQRQELDKLVGYFMRYAVRKP